MFGGFILHFLLANYLTVLLRPSYEEPVETTADVVNRDIIPFLWPGADIFIQFFAASSDPNYQEVSRRFVVAKDWDEYYELVSKMISTGLYAEIGTAPDPVVVSEEEYKDWYRSSETIAGKYLYPGHLLNKKWPFKKVYIFFH